MPTRKIRDLAPLPCRHPEHDPPSHMVFEPGHYEHTCPACHHKTVFTVNPPTMSTPRVAQKPIRFGVASYGTHVSKNWTF